MQIADGRASTLVMVAALLAVAPATAPAGGQQPGIAHIVLCWLKNPGNEDHRRKVIEVSRELEIIPEVEGMAVGPPLPGERAIVDDSFDVGIVMNFRSADDLNIYLEHPEHVRRVKETLLPLCGQVRVHDIRY